MRRLLREDGGATLVVVTVRPGRGRSSISSPRSVTPSASAISGVPLPVLQKWRRYVAINHSLSEIRINKYDRVIYDDMVQKLLETFKYFLKN